MMLQPETTDAVDGLTSLSLDITNIFCSNVLEILIYNNLLKKFAQKVSLVSNHGEFK